MPLIKKPHTISVLLRSFGGYRKHILALTVLGFLGALLEGVGINATIPLLSFFFNGQGTSGDFVSKSIGSLFSLVSINLSFQTLVIFIIILFMARAIALVAFGYLRGWITADFLRVESGKLLHNTLVASWPFLLRQKLGTIHSTLVRDVQRTGSLLESVSQVIQSFTGVFIYLLIAVNISPITTLLTVIGGAVLLLVIRPFLARTRRTGAGMSGTEKGISQFLSEHIIGMKTLKAAGVEANAFQTGKRMLDTLRNLQLRLALTRSVSSGLFQPFTIIFVVILFWITYQTPEFNIISFAAVLYLIQKIFTYLESGQSALHAVSELIPYAENVSEFSSKIEHHAEKRQDGNQNFSFARTLEFKNVSLAYVENVPVLHNLELSIPQGATVALIGPSGAGKTSVADLVLRLFEPTTGTILLDGLDIRSVDRNEWRRHIGYVSQDTFLLNGTIEENIRFYRTDISRETIEHAAKRANIYKFIMNLPDGFNAQVGDRGVMLSGGQRQRIALARALVSSPEILVLDEATSALDSESERLIQQAIQDIHGQTTVFIIAHRLSTIENADTILVFAGGKIIERGSPAELLAIPDSYLSQHGKLQTP